MTGALGEILGRKRSWNPVVGLMIWKKEAARHDSQDRCRLTVHQDGTANHRGSAAKAPLPEGIAQDYDFALGSVLFGSKRPPNRGLNAEHIEKVGSDTPAKHFLRCLISGESGIGVTQGDHVRENLVLRAPVYVVARSGSIVSEAEIGGVFPHHHEAAWVCIRQRVQQHTLHRAENSRVGANAESQSRKGYGKETGIAPHLSKRGTKVGVEVHAVEDVNSEKRFLQFQHLVGARHAVPILVFLGLGHVPNQPTPLRH